MTDHNALLRTICQSPDDDVPRLIYADFLEETGEAARAEFVRAQVELARTPNWEPFAVLCRNRKLEWSEAGEPFRASLPPLGPDVTWHARPFRRGLGWRVNVRSLHTWNDIAPRLYEFAPVGELYLNPPATRDDWRAFASGEWVKRFRVIHLGGGSPVEPIRALCENPDACGITDIHFHRASSPGLPELLEDLLATPLGKGLKGLHFSAGYEWRDLLMETLGNADIALERLTFRTMLLFDEWIDRLLQMPLARRLIELTLHNDRVGYRPEQSERHVDWFARLPETIRHLDLDQSHLTEPDLESLANQNALRGLRSLDLSRNPRAGYVDLPTGGALYDSEILSGVRVLGLREVPSRDGLLARVASSQFWPGLVSLDLRGVYDFGIKSRSMQRPEHLTALWMDEHHRSGSAWLREQLGECVLFGSMNEWMDTVRTNVTS